MCSEPLLEPPRLSLLPPATCPIPTSSVFFPEVRSKKRTLQTESLAFVSSDATVLADASAEKKKKPRVKKNKNDNGMLIENEATVVAEELQKAGILGILGQEKKQELETWVHQLLLETHFKIQRVLDEKQPSVSSSSSSFAEEGNLPVISSQKMNRLFKLVKNIAIQTYVGLETYFLHTEKYEDDVFVSSSSVVAVAVAVPVEENPNSPSETSTLAAAASPVGTSVVVPFRPNIQRALEYVRTEKQFRKPHRRLFAKLKTSLTSNVLQSHFQTSPKYNPAFKASWECDLYQELKAVDQMPLFSASRMEELERLVDAVCTDVFFQIDEYYLQQE